VRKACGRSGGYGVVSFVLRAARGAAALRARCCVSRIY